MKKTSETIVFFGSGPVAAESLRLLAKNFTVEAAITKPRPVHHKGEVPVITTAEELKIPIFTAQDKYTLNTLFSKATFQSRLGVLIDFGIIISNEVINFFPLGIVNSHFSVLPEWRGADPITYSILSGQRQTGVSLMLLVEAMDEGPLLSYGEYDIRDDLTTPELTTDLIGLSNSLLEVVLPAYTEGQIKPAPQTITGREISYSQKLKKEDGVIDWQESAVSIERKIRAYIEWPTTHAKLKDLEVILTKAEVLDKKNGNPGDITVTDDKFPLICCGKGSLKLLSLKPLGKKEMSGKSFLAGYLDRLR